MFSTSVIEIHKVLYIPTEILPSWKEAPKTQNVLKVGVFSTQQKNFLRSGIKPFKDFKKSISETDQFHQAPPSSSIYKL